MKVMTDSVLRGRLVLENSIVDDGIIEIDGSTITRVCPVSDYDGELPEATDSTFLPGLVDVHCHGGGGESFPNAETAEAALVAVKEHRRHGTTTLVAVPRRSLSSPPLARSPASTSRVPSSPMSAVVPRTRHTSSILTRI